MNDNPFSIPLEDIDSLAQARKEPSIPEGSPVIRIVDKKKLKRPKFKRGQFVLAMLIWPKERTTELVYLLRVEGYLHDRDQDRKFLTSEPPALEIVQGKRKYDCYLVDAEKGCTVSAKFNRSAQLLEVNTNAKLVDSLLDKSFVTQVSTLKPDWKSMAGMAFGAMIFGFLFGVIL